MSQHEKEHVGGHESHGGRSDLGSSGEGQLSHAASVLIDEWREAVKFWHLPTAHVDYGKIVACGQRLANYVKDVKPPTDAWQKIDTAPKDGTWILLLTQSGDVWKASWGIDRQQVETWCSSRQSLLGYAVTHWMALPDPPVVGCASVSNERSELSASLPSASAKNELSHLDPSAAVKTEPLPNIDRYLTVGDLRHLTQGLPDSAKVYYQRIEDAYFEKHGWKTVEQPGDHGPDHFVRAFTAWPSDEDGGMFFITAHY